MDKPAPPGWNKTLDDLFAEMKRGERLSASRDESNWAIEYEISLMPPTTVFPVGGQTWKAIRDCEVTVRTHFAAPGSGSECATLPAGEPVRILPSAREKRILVSFVPVNYEPLHGRLVSRATRRTPRYGGYSLSIKTVAFNENFELMES